MDVLGRHFDRYAQPIVGKPDRHVAGAREKPLGFEQRLHHDGLEPAQRRADLLAPHHLHLGIP